MSTLSDARFDSLRSQGYLGSDAEMVLGWLQGNGATSDATQGAWDEMLDGQGYSDGHIGDRWFALLGDLGYVGAIPKRERDFWLSGGSFAPAAPVFTLQPVNTTVTEGQTALFTSNATGSPAVSYQWQTGAGANLPGEISKNLSLELASTSQSGNTYKCVATNTEGTVTSSTVTLTVAQADYRSLTGQIIYGGRAA